MYLSGEKGDPSDYHHHDHQQCDSCDKTQDGTMIYARARTGIIHAVIFLCKECDIVSYANTKSVPPILKQIKGRT